MKSDEELAGLFVPVLEEHGMQVVGSLDCAKAAGAGTNESGADLNNHIFTKGYVQNVVSFIKERATFVKDFWTIASYLFVSPQDFGKYGIKAGAAVEPQSNDPRRQADPRAKVYDDTATAPFLAKDVDKFWKPEVADYVAKVASFVDEYSGEWSVPAFEKALEDFIRGNEWPMGKVMNATRLALAGAASGLGIADIIVRIGKPETIARIAYATSRLA